jgi:peptidoglycan/LPS O-acetylase OafA/YrhL
MRRDLQGLRAFGVLVVLATHVSGVPAGGHVTVDMFFVISGFLITALLLSEQVRTGRISLTQFFRRRVKRLFPTAFVVGAVAVGFCALVFSPARLETVTTDALWAGVFLENWHLAAAQTDYFAAGGPVSPFQHYWSLSVEEQFYLVWPVVVVVAFLLARGRPGVARRVACATVAIVSAASLVWAWYESAESPDVAYFSTFDRAWELGTGSLLAFGIAMWERAPRWSGTIVMWLGIGGLAVAMVIVPERPGFPAPWGLLPILSTGAVLVGGASTAVRPPAFLANRVTDYVGGLSYSLYLVHFPVLVIIRSIEPAVDWLTYPISVVLAVAVHHAVEVPGMRLGWRALIERRGRAPKSFEIPVVSRSVPVFATIAVATLTILVGGVAVWSVRPRTPVPLSTASAEEASPPDSAQGAVADDGDRTDPDPAGSALRAELTEALAAVTWPDFDPALDEAGSGGTTEACGRLRDPRPLRDCSFGPADAPTTVMLVGDSTAAYQAEALAAIAAEPANELRLVTRTAWSCSFAALPIGPSVSQDCVDYREAALAAVAEVRPDVLVIMNTFGRIATADGAVSGQAWSDAVSTYAEQASASASVVVHLAPPPSGPDPAECVRPGGMPSDCLTSSAGQWESRWAAAESIADRLGQTAIDIRPLVCVETRCPVYAGTTLIRFDGVHLAPAYARKMAPALLELLRPALPGPRSPLDAEP